MAAQVTAIHTVAPTQDELAAEIRDRFETLRRLVVGVIEGHHRSVIVSGAPGVGKTFTVTKMLGEAQRWGLVNNVTVISGTLSPIGFVTTLWENRCPGGVLVLDDADGLLTDENGLNLVKAATDSGKTRTISYLKDARLLREKGIPNSFEFSGAVIFASNLDIEAAAQAKTKIGTHLAAILNRALYLDLGMRSQQALLVRIADVVRNTPMLRDEGLDAGQAEALLLWIEANAQSIRSLSLRTVVQIARLTLSEPRGWEKTAAATLLRPPAR